VRLRYRRLAVLRRYFRCFYARMARVHRRRQRRLVLLHKPLRRLCDQHTAATALQVLRLVAASFHAPRSELRRWENEKLRVHALAA
jgi:hypothetical protein